VSSLSYYLLWLGGGLVVSAAISAGITRHLYLRLQRRLKALQLLDALGCYSDWVASQGRMHFFQRQESQADSLLQQVWDIGQQWFPELSNETAEIFAVHARLIEFLQTQHALSVCDAETWLESDHERQFMNLWRPHVRAVNGIVTKLRAVAELGQVQSETFAS